MIEFQEDSDPLLGYLREMGMIINQAQFQANQANSYLDQRPGLEMLMPVNGIVTELIWIPVSSGGVASICFQKTGSLFFDLLRRWNCQRSS